MGEFGLYRWKKNLKLWNKWLLAFEKLEFFLTQICVLLKHVFLFSFKAPSEKIPRLLSTCPGGERSHLNNSIYVYINIELGKKQRPPFHTNKPVYIYIYIYTYSLRTHRLSAEGLTRNYHLSVCLTRVSFADSDRNCAKHLHIAYLIDNFVFTLWWLLWYGFQSLPKFKFYF